MKFSKLLMLLLTAALLLSLCACGGEELSAEAEYQITVVDAKGQPMTSGVIVCFLQNGQQAAMQVVDAQGCAVKTLARGEYTVELKFTDSEVSYVYDASQAKLTAENTQATVSLLHGITGEAAALFAGGEDTTAYYVDAVSTQVPLTAGGRSYFLFAPTQAGTYQVSVQGEGLALGCYGTPFYVQEFSIFEVVDNSFTMSIRADMIGSGEGGSNVMVIGIDSETATDCVLTVDRTGDPEWSVDDEPWTVYETTAQLSAYTLPAGASVQPFDLTRSYELVFNETDGSYHLNSADGPQVLVFLGQDCKYINCYQTILTKTGVKKYFYDEAGNFLKKEAYDTCLREYFTYMDAETGVYPLTKDLEYIIKNHGGYNGWWDMDSNTCIILDQAGNPEVGINEEFGWLLMCGYIAQ